MNKKLLVFNWKMNPKTLKQAIILAKTSDFENTIIAPPFIFIEEIGKILKKAGLGAQDLSWKSKGALTGEISADELKNLGVKYVIIGHSERRQIIGETDTIINKKVIAALKAGLKVILCVGEPSRPTTDNLQPTTKAKQYVKNQLQKDLRNLKFQISNFKLRNHLMIAYEPVWAIGTGKNNTPEDASKIIKFIKQTLVASGYTPNPKVLYGGSVNSKNLKDFLKYKEIDGFLVGGASLKIKEIKSIIKSI